MLCVWLWTFFTVTDYDDNNYVFLCYFCSPINKPTLLNAFYLSYGLWNNVFARFSNEFILLCSVLSLSSYKYALLSIDELFPISMLPLDMVLDSLVFLSILTLPLFAYIFCEPLNLPSKYLYTSIADLIFVNAFT